MPPRASPGGKPPVTVHIYGPTWEAILEVPGIFGDAAGVAARMRGQGLAAQRKGKEVVVNANHIPERLQHETST